MNLYTEMRVVDLEARRALRVLTPLGLAAGPARYFADGHATVDNGDGTRVSLQFEFEVQAADIEAAFAGAEAAAKAEADAAVAEYKKLRTRQILSGGIASMPSRGGGGNGRLY